MIECYRWRNPLMLAVIVAGLAATDVATAQERLPPPVLPRTREGMEANRARREAGLPDPSDTPAYRALFDAYMADLDAFMSPAEPPTAEALIDQLYEEKGDPELNRRWQAIVVDAIEGAARRHARANRTEQLDVLRQGLFDYAIKGGGTGNPAVEIELAQALAATADLECDACLKHAQERAEHAQAWAKELGAPYEGLVADKYEAFQELMQRRLLAALPPEQRAARLDEIVDATFQSLSDADTVTQTMIAKAWKLATVASNTPDRREDLVARMLIAYRKVLERQRGVPKDVIRNLDWKLMALARYTEHLTTERHWDLWAEATAALGQRASRDLRMYVSDATITETDPVIQRALRTVRVALRRPAAAPEPDPPPGSGLQDAAPAQEP